MLGLEALECAQDARVMVKGFVPQLLDLAFGALQISCGNRFLSQPRIPVLLMLLLQCVDLPLCLTNLGLQLLNCLFRLTLRLLVGEGRVLVPFLKLDGHLFDLLRGLFLALRQTRGQLFVDLLAEPVHGWHAFEIFQVCRDLLHLLRG